MAAILHDWLDSWSGLALIIAGMTYQGWDVQLTAYAARDWRANFFPVGSRTPRRRLGVGADAVAGGAAGGVGSCTLIECFLPEDRHTRPGSSIPLAWRHRHGSSSSSASTRQRGP
jgi:hypothetical protein